MALWYLFLRLCNARSASLTRLSALFRLRYARAQRSARVKDFEQTLIGLPASSRLSLSLFIGTETEKEVNLPFLDRGFFFRDAFVGVDEAIPPKIMGDAMISRGHLVVVGRLGYSTCFGAPVSTFKSVGYGWQDFTLDRWTQNLSEPN